MTERSDINTDWALDPRLIEVEEPSVALLLQDLVDTLRSNTLQPGEADDSLDNMDDDFILDAVGKADLGSGRETGITATLQQAQVLFESRLTPDEEGTVTTGDVAGTTLIDAAATFQTNLITRGAVVINFGDESITEVLTVDSEIQCTTRVLRSGNNNDYGVGDVYKVWNVDQCVISGGNLVAVDDLLAATSAIFPTFCTQIILESDTSAAGTDPASISDAVWNAVVADFTAAGTFGAKVGLQLLTFAKWIGLRGGPGK